MRRGEVSWLTNVLMQVVLATAIVALFWFPYQQDAFNGKLYQEKAYTTDNALLLSTLHAIPSGTMRVTYLLDDPSYTIWLSQGTVLFTRGASGSSPTKGIFAKDQDVRISPYTFSPQYFQYIKTPSDLSVQVVAQADQCAMPAQPVDWNGKTVAWTGDAEAARILGDGLFRVSPQVVKASSSTAPVTTLDYTIGKQSGYIIVHGTGMASSAIACLADQEFTDRGLTPVTVRTDPTVQGVTLSVPKSHDTNTVHDAMSCAYNRFVAPEVVKRGCQ